MRRKSTSGMLVIAIAAICVMGCPNGPTGSRFESITVESSVFFGDDDCSIGIVPGLPGLTETDPGGFRLLGVGEDGSGGRLVFGETELCAIQTDPMGPPGLQLLDPRGFNLLNPNGDLEPVQLNFGPTGLCAIKIRPQGPGGLWFCDPNGVRIVNPLGETEPMRLLFGETENCAIQVLPEGPQGLVLSDPRGIRILPNPLDPDPDPPLPFRLLFGPTDLCAIQVDPAGPRGLQLRDPDGIRILNPNVGEPPQLAFGPTDDCVIQAVANRGLVLTDPIAVNVDSPILNVAGRIVVDEFESRVNLLESLEVERSISFGEGVCRIGLEEGLAGLTATDPNGFRLIGFGEGGNGGRLNFGPTELCSIFTDPRGLLGLQLSDPNGVRVVNPLGPEEPVRLLFGETDLCSIQIDPLGLRGLQFSDPEGVRILNPLEEGMPRLVFGPSNECFIEAIPQEGIGISDPFAVAVNSPLLNVEGQVTAEEFVSRSSRELKRNIKPLEHALDTIGRLNGVSFEWKTGPEGKADIGFIAEEVAEVLPELTVKSSDGKSVEGLKYPNLVAVAVEGIKEQQGQIEALRDENRMLQENLAAMQRQMAEMADALAAVQSR